MSIEFLPPNSSEEERLSKKYVVIKEKEGSKYFPGQIVDLLKKY
jgi:hypothetical protein